MSDFELKDEHKRNWQHAIEWEKGIPRTAGAIVAVSLADALVRTLAGKRKAEAINIAYRLGSRNYKGIDWSDAKWIAEARKELEQP